MSHARADIAGEPGDRPRPLGFPMRVAAIDVGSNAFRFIAAEFSAPGRYTELSAERVPVRLGHSAFLTGELSASAIDKTITGFRRFRREIDRLGNRPRAGGWRRARCARVGTVPISCAGSRTRPGIRIRLISGIEEARLVWVAVKSRIDLPRGEVDARGPWRRERRSVARRPFPGSCGASRTGWARFGCWRSWPVPRTPPAHFANLLAEYAATLPHPPCEQALTPVRLIATCGQHRGARRMAGERGPDGAEGVMRISRARLGSGDRGILAALVQPAHWAPRAARGSGRRHPPGRIVL